MAESPLILPVFLPHLGCRERCLFCNQKATASEVPSPFAVRKFIEDSLTRLPTERNGRKKQVGFYGGSFTAIDREDQVRYLGEVQPFLSSGLIDSIRISTRPDALGGETLTLLRDHGVRTVELGAQSMVDEVLFLSRRGHCAEETSSAVTRLRQQDFEAGLHLMIGLPGDSPDYFSQTLDRVIALKPDFVRIHPALVLRGASLEDLWRSGGYSPLSLDETVQWLKKGLLKLERASIPVARIGLQPAKELEDHLLAGPYHPALHQLVDSAIFFDMASSLLGPSPGDLDPVFYCHPADSSNVRGQKNGNTAKLRERFGLKGISIAARDNVVKDTLILRGPGGESSIHRRDLWVSGDRG
jgi:histone acetyltransferase (RNA polymerase elongator complex component)